MLRRQIDLATKLARMSSNVHCSFSNQTLIQEILSIDINIQRFTSQKYKHIHTKSPISTQSLLDQSPMSRIVVSRLTTTHSPSPFLRRSISSTSSDLTLSKKAIERLKKLQQEAGSTPLYLRLMVEGGGCSGFQYEFSLEHKGPQKGDQVISSDGATLLCDDVSVEFLKGATIDFESDLMRSSFVVHNNPNAESSCGCGSSFAVK